MGLKTNYLGGICLGTSLLRWREFGGKILSDKGFFGKFRAVMNPEEIAYEIAQELKNKGLEEEAKKYFQKLEEMENERLRYEEDYKLWKEYRMEKLKNISHSAIFSPKKV